MMDGFRSWRLLIALSFFLHSPICSCEKAPNYSFMRDAAESPTWTYFDYIIIGGGTAGCPLAATLSQNASVLLLERGGAPYNNPNITRLSAFGAAISDLSDDSPSQRFISQDGVINARARVLGGGSALNAGFYTRAGTEYIRNMGWNESLANESYQWVEDKVAFQPPMGPWQTAVRNGLLEAGVGPNNGFTYDHINGTKFGGTIFDREGHRHTAADLLEYANPKGITVLLYATVHRILFRTRGTTKPIANGVVYRDRNGQAHRAYLNNGSSNEIILSAGTLGSPQLMMLSGVGPYDQLQAHNIAVVMDQPHVGRGMYDNPMNAVFVPSPIPVELSLIEVVGITDEGTYVEAASGANFGGGASTRGRPFQGGFLLEKVMGPVSSGHMELRTRSPHDNPIVTFNYFQQPEDLKRCVRGIQTIKRVVQSRAFARYKYWGMSFERMLSLTARARVNLRPPRRGPRAWLPPTPEEFCQHTVTTIWHYHGGCVVGRVVDEDYKVIGIDRLRVIDMSTVNYCPGTNPQATVMMLGRYMGVKILRERLAKK